MVEIRFVGTEQYQFPDEIKERITEVIGDAETEAKALLPKLSTNLSLTVKAGKEVIPEKGEVGRALGVDSIEVVIDPHHKRPILEIIDTEFRRMFFHEAHHTVRMATSKFKESLVSDAIFEGLGTVFERDFAGGEQPWGQYDNSVIHDWALELLSLDDNSINRRDWFFDHPDGRRWIAYRVGTYIVDQAIKNNPGMTATTLVDVSSKDILAMSGIAP